MVRETCGRINKRQYLLFTDFGNCEPFTIHLLQPPDMCKLFGLIVFYMKGAWLHMEYGKNALYY